MKQRILFMLPPLARRASRLLSFSRHRSSHLPLQDRDGSANSSDGRVVQHSSYGVSAPTHTTYVLAFPNSKHDPSDESLCMRGLGFGCRLKALIRCMACRIVSSD